MEIFLIFYTENIFYAIFREYIQFVTLLLIYKMVVRKILVWGTNFFAENWSPAEIFGPSPGFLAGTMPTLVPRQQYHAFGVIRVIFCHRLSHRKGLLYSFVTVRPKFHGKLLHGRTKIFSGGPFFAKKLVRETEILWKIGSCQDQNFQRGTNFL